MQAGPKTAANGSRHAGTGAYINRIGTAVPANDVHHRFLEFGAELLRDDRICQLFRRVAARSGIKHRYSVLSLDPASAERAPHLDANQIYVHGGFPDTAQRMRLFEQTAPALAARALDRLALSSAERARVTHVIVTSCTGLYAPGLDFHIIDHLGLSPAVERTTIGFMGCYAAVNALKVARHIVRSEPVSTVLILNLELCTLHFQETQQLEQVLSFLIFSDGCAATLVSAEPAGLALDSFRAVVIPETRDLITWNIGSLGFDMMLSGRVPGEIATSLRHAAEEITGPGGTGSIDRWAVHPGGRSVLDAVEDGLGLAPAKLAESRCVLERFGNMSSATVMFVLEEVLRTAQPGERGCGMSFGPGLTAETLLFHAV